MCVELHGHLVQANATGHTICVSTISIICEWILDNTNTMRKYVKHLLAKPYQEAQLEGTQQTAVVECQGAEGECQSGADWGVGGRTCWKEGPHLTDNKVRDKNQHTKTNHKVI